MLFWATITLIAGLLLVLVEVFIPSGGLLGFLSAATLLLSLILAFSTSTGLGVLFFLVICAAVPGIVTIGFHYLPHTPFGKKFFLAQPTREEIDPTGPRELWLRSLQGQVGRTITPLRPAGLSEFAGRRIDTVAEGAMVEQGRPVQVVVVQGNRVVVREVPAEGPPLSTAAFEAPNFELPAS